MIRSIGRTSGLLVAVCALLIHDVSAQTPLPDVDLQPVLLAAGVNGSIRLVTRRIVQEQVTKEYTVQVPVAEQRIVNGRRITVTTMREELRTREVAVPKMVAEEIMLEPGQFELRRASGGRFQAYELASQFRREVPAVAVEVDNLANPQLPLFYRQVLNPETPIVFTSRGGEPTNPYGPRPVDPSSPSRPDPPGVMNEVGLTIVNRSRRPVSVFYEDAQQSKEVSFFPSVRPGESKEGTITYGGTRWLAKFNDKVVSEFFAPNEPIATWTIGPPVAFSTWRGRGGESFVQGRDDVWSQYDRNGNLIGELYEEERTEERVALFDQTRSMWVRLMETEAIYSAPGVDGWQPLATRDR